MCLLSFLLHLAFCLSTYSANLHVNVVLPCLLLLPVVLLLILGLFVLIVSLVCSFFVYVVLVFGFGL